MQTPQQYGSASSYGKKYALGNLFLIDDTQDSDATNSHGQNGSNVVKKKKLTQKDPAFGKALAYVKAGGDVATIKAKYELTAATEKALTSNK